MLGLGAAWTWVPGCTPSSGPLPGLVACTAQMSPTGFSVPHGLEEAAALG